jgi:hypothetical protein
MDYQGRGLILPFKFGRLDLGGEVAYQYLFWYSRQAYGSTYSYTYQAMATSVMAVGRVDLKKGLFADFGAGGFFLHGGGTNGQSDFGLAGALGYNIKLRKNIMLPIKFRTDFVLDSATPLIVPSVTAGIAFKFGKAPK